MRTHRTESAKAMMGDGVPGQYNDFVDADPSTQFEGVMRECSDRCYCASSDAIFRLTILSTEFYDDDAVFFTQETVCAELVDELDE